MCTQLLGLLFQDCSPQGRGLRPTSSVMAPSRTARRGGPRCKEHIWPSPRCKRWSSDWLSLALVTLLTTCYLAAAQSTPTPSPVEHQAENSFIWQTWTDRRPIGQLILAGASRGKEDPPGSDSWTDWNKWNLPNVDYRTPAGLTDFHQKMLAYCATTRDNILKVGGQGVIVWDIEGEGRGYLTFLGDPRLTHACAPEVDSIADEMFAIFKKAGLRIGVCLRADTIALKADGLPVSQTHQSYYKSRAQAVGDLDAKLSYAKNRWGCTIFYIDSNGDDGQYIGEKDRAGIYPASVYQELFRRHPDCLFCPEEYYNNGTGGSNDSYSRVTAPYEELRVSSPAVGGVSDYPAGTRNQFPGAFMLLCISDGDIKGNKAKLVAGVRAGNILLFRAWFWSHEMDDVTEILNAAKSAHR